MASKTINKMKISRKLFNEIFEVSYYNNEFERLELDEEKLIIWHCSIIHYRNVSSGFVEKLQKIGFGRSKDPLMPFSYAIYIKKEYIESIRNLMDLAVSSDTANHNVAYQIFQNIKQYSITK